MTKEQINIAIAEAQGFRERGGGPFGIYYDKEDDDRYWVSPEYIEGFKPPWTDFDGTVYYPLPDYCNDLNAMHEVELSLTTQKFETFWIKLASMHPEEARYAVSATAAQRAEAYLRTIGKWNEH